MRHPAHDLPPLDPRQRYTIDEAATYLRMSRALLYRRIAAGDIDTVTEGRRYVPGRAIAARSGADDTPTDSCA